jgi:hypothetical protein
MDIAVNSSCNAFLSMRDLRQKTDRRKTKERERRGKVKEC